MQKFRTELHGEVHLPIVSDRKISLKNASHRNNSKQLNPMIDSNLHIMHVKPILIVLVNSQDIR